MGTKRGPLAVWDKSQPLFIKPQPDVFDGTHFAIGYYTHCVNGHEAAFIVLQGYARERDARRAMRNYGFVQEGARWVHESTLLLRMMESAT
jgi:hypothetical protein